MIRRHLRVRFTTAALAVALLPVAVVAASDEVRLELRDHAGLQKLVESKRGKVVVMDAWSTYCEPCMREFPGLVGLHKKYGDRLACISVCANYSGIGKPEEEVDEPLKFLKEKGAAFDNVLSTEKDETLYKKLGISSVPCIFVFDRDGKLLKKFENEAKYAEIEAFVVPLLK